MEFTEDFIKEIKTYFSNPNFSKLLQDLGICNLNDLEQEKIEAIKRYILETMMGKFHLDSSIKKFLAAIDNYMKNGNEFIYNEQGEVDCDLLLPVKENVTREGFRVSNGLLGPDGNVYICKFPEGLKGPTSGMKGNKLGKYNPMVAEAVFTFLGEESAEFKLANSKDNLYRYYVLSKNFLGKNQKMITVEKIAQEDNLFADENNNISHEQIINIIERYIRKKLSGSQNGISVDETCKNVILQYAIQETLKKFIISVDENIGNTALIVDEDENGEISNINLSPVYDTDLSFLLGEQVLEADYSNQNFYRTNREGQSDLASIMEEFSSIPGYLERIRVILDKLNGNYVQGVLDIAHANSNVSYFQTSEAKESYGSFLTMQVAKFKAIYKTIIDRAQTKEKTISE